MQVPLAAGAAVAVGVAFAVPLPGDDDCLLVLIQ